MVGEVLKTRRQAAGRLPLVCGLIVLLGACAALAPSRSLGPAATPAAVSVQPTGTPRPPSASPTPNEPTPTPFIWPTLPASPTPVCPGAPRTRLIVQERARVLPDDPLPVRLREGPGLDKRILELIPIRAVFYVLDGPICNGGYSWFKVRYQEIEGWIAEGRLQDGAISYFVEPYLPG
ncbi:MAG: hypothetical protein HXY41_17750 [Chloroflexi bacterium]|nr:hypothetical protein [Chloroflexota bacterium]